MFAVESIPIVPSRTCWRCLRGFDRPLGIGWVPRHPGWECPDCARAYERRIDELARDLLRAPGRDWLNTHKCVRLAGYERCDVIRRATLLELSAPEWAPPQRRAR